MPDCPTPRHSVSVAAAIFDDSGDNVLLIQRRDNGRWEPPGGVLELEEAIEDGLRREVREETGAEISVGSLTGVYKNMTLGVIALVFNAQALTNPTRHSVEAKQVAWVALEEIPRLMTEPFAVRIVDATRGGDPKVRLHDGIRLIKGGGF